jgi:colanic acid/amylovoran biosynthesis glycosyltransferase
LPELRIERHYNKNKLRTLIYLVHTIPESGGFCKTEFKYLSEKFRNIHIISAVHGYEQVKEFPNGSKLHTFQPQLSKVEKYLSLIKILNVYFWKDLFWLVISKKVSFSFPLVNTLLQELLLATKLQKFIYSISPEVQSNDSVVIYSFWMNYSALAATLIKIDKPNVQIVSRSHGSDLYFEAQAFKFLPFRKLIAEKMDRIFFISKMGKDYFERLVGFKSERWSIAYLGSEPPNKKIPLENGAEKTIVSCSMISPVKRLSLLMEGFSLVKEDVKWIHIGDGPDLKKLIAESQKLPTNIKTEFIGYLDQNKVVDKLSQLMPIALINVSSSEGLPVSMMEAMSVGIPVIATDVGGVGEIVENTYNGIFLNANPTSVDIAKSISWILSLPVEDLNKIRLNANKTWSIRFNADENYTNFASELHQLATRNELIPPEFKF